MASKDPLRVVRIARLPDPNRAVIGRHGNFLAGRIEGYEKKSRISKAVILYERLVLHVP
jgi:hypothetical protein